MCCICFIMWLRNWLLPTKHYDRYKKNDMIQWKIKHCSKEEHWKRYKNNSLKQVKQIPFLVDLYLRKPIAKFTVGIRLIRNFLEQWMILKYTCSIAIAWREWDWCRVAWERAGRTMTLLQRVWSRSVYTLVIDMCVYWKTSDISK